MNRDKDELEDFSRLVRTLYASLVADQPWYGFLTEFRDQLGAQFATLIVSRASSVAPSLMVTPLGNPQGIEDYCDHLFRIDPFTDLPEGKVVSQFEHLSERGFKQSAFYRDYLQYEDTSHILGFDLRTGGFVTAIRVTRTSDGQPYGATERARCERIIPHIRQAMDIYQRLETSRSEHAVYSGAVEQFALGAVILDEHNNIIRCNPIAEAILDEADGIARTGRRVSLGNATSDADFRNFLRDARGPAGSAHVFRVERPSGRRDIGIVARPIETPDYLHAASAPALALYLGDPERQMQVNADALRDLFNLTPTEAAISACVANGLSVHESAERLGIASNTVRAHLRSIFAKTGVARQSQLVHLVHTSLPELAARR
ncbi:DNA-binding transcriptional regulator, CsgD family [Sphingomonas laterariae]|uniref:DNA-binding transcriptional regulator, CsgD family n=1 Tax=Edaphosphingomonas laterariae TaxID=861865 RepID=A0A239J4Y3_9SPHN|nr:helix-turn-helix transcriptional regulator [Sphingomonas laterariae]SNT01086.1 DNA-binding transcriptional regulator, CsgD family [Sphingomonas laterariae]